MMTNIQQQMKQLQMQIIDNNYYEDLYNSCVINADMSRRGIQEGIYSEEQIVNLCNDFWEALPDSHAIQRKPFRLLCDLCEGIDS